MELLRLKSDLDNVLFRVSKKIDSLNPRYSPISSVLPCICRYERFKLCVCFLSIITHCSHNSDRVTFLAVPHQQPWEPCLQYQHPFGDTRSIFESAFISSFPSVSRMLPLTSEVDTDFSPKSYRNRDNTNKSVETAFFDIHIS